MKLGSVLVLGAGRSRDQRIQTKANQGPTFDDNFERVVTLDQNETVNPDIHESFQASKFKETVLPHNYYQLFDQVHAYECLHLVGGNAWGFFRVWSNIWDVLKEGGLACATTPWWQSKWVFQDPASLDVYTPERLWYLDRSRADYPMMTDYSHLWPEPKSFRPIHVAQRGEDPTNAGFTFVLRKELYVPGQD